MIRNEKKKKKRHVCMLIEVQLIKYYKLVIFHMYYNNKTAYVQSKETKKIRGIKIISFYFCFGALKLIAHLYSIW